MTQTVLQVTVLVALAMLAVAALRRFPDPIRLTFDAVCFAAITAYFTWQGRAPMFSPLSGTTDLVGLSLRLVGGAWWLFGARLAVAALRFAFHRDRRTRETRLFSDLAAGGIYVATALVVLNSVFAVPVTGVVATSGVVAIVLGLALQNTLSDVFSGIAVGVEAPFRLGDRVKLNEGLEGVVAQVNWRSIWIQTDGDDIAIIPNSVVAKAEILNRSFPTERSATAVTLSCTAVAAPERVIETLLQATLLCPEILQTPAPAAVITHLGVERNAFKVSFHVEAASKLGGAKDTLLRLARRQLHYAGLLDRRPPGAPVESAAEIDAHARRQLVRDVILFESLGDSQVTALALALGSRRLEPGEILFAQNDADQALYLVASGVIELTRLADDGEALGCIGAGEYVGEIGLLTGAPHPATATARTHSLVYRLPHEELASLLAQNADLATAFDRSARKGLQLLHRGIVARTAAEIGRPGQLLRRIRSFFSLSAA